MMLRPSVNARSTISTVRSVSSKRRTVSTSSTKRPTGSLAYLPTCSSKYKIDMFLSSYSVSIISLLPGINIYCMEIDNHHKSSIEQIYQGYSVDNNAFLGSGRYSRVYKGFDQSKKLIAVKIIDVKSNSVKREREY